MINDSISHRLRLRSIRQSKVQPVLDFEKKMKIYMESDNDVNRLSKKWRNNE